MKSLVTVLNRIIPKKNIILFDSNPDFSDNSYALYKYILSEREDILSNYEIVWSKNDNINCKPPNCKVIIKNSIHGLWVFLRSKYVITTHGFFSEVKSSKKQIQICLWHGCGYKSFRKNDHLYRGDYTIITSKLYQNIHMEAFKLPQSNVLITGLPRNDDLLKKNNALLKLGINNIEFKYVYIWLPTYRGLFDGNQKSFGIHSLNENQFQKLNTVLKNKNIMLIIKIHMYDSGALDNISYLSNIQCYNDQDLKQYDVELYQLLSESDGLLSDYSSVAIDYLLQKKPVVYVFSDLEEYMDNRGFNFEPVTDYMPGPIINNFKELIRYFEYCENINEKWKKERNSVARKFHQYFDSNSSKRICDFFWGEK